MTIAITILIIVLGIGIGFLFEAYRYELSRANRLAALVTEYQSHFEILKEINHNLTEELEESLPKYKKFIVPRDIPKGTWVTVDEAFEKVFVDD